MPTLNPKTDGLKDCYVRADNCASADHDADRVRDKHARPDFGIELNFRACKRDAQSRKKPSQVDPASLKKPMAHSIKQDSLKARFEN
jgi:hypothetical protein